MFLSFFNYYFLYLFIYLMLKLSVATRHALTSATRKWGVSVCAAEGCLHLMQLFKNESCDDKLDQLRFNNKK